MCFKKYGHSFFSAFILRKIQHLLFYFVEGIDNFIKFGRILCVVFSFETIISRPKNAKSFINCCGPTKKNIKLCSSF